MKTCIPEERRIETRTTEVQMCVVLPGEAHAAMQLNGLCCQGVERIRAPGLGDGGVGRQILRVIPGDALQAGTSHLDLDQRIGHTVLNRLEAADLAIELSTQLDVLEGHVEAVLSTAELIRTNGEQADVESALDGNQAGSAGGEADRCCRGEGDSGRRATEVQGGQCGDRGIRALDDVEIDTGRRACRDNEETRRCAIGHEAHGAVDGCFGARAGNTLNCEPSA